MAVQDIHSPNKIMSRFLKLEESALFLISSYLSKLGISVWAPNFMQTAYSMYNMAMQMCAIDTFCFLVSATHYDFLKPNTKYVKDTVMLPQMYDHFVHFHMYKIWKTEVKKLGGTLTLTDRNTASRNRRHLCATYLAYLKECHAPARFNATIVPKATSDDERRPEHSEIMDKFVRSVEGMILQSLREDGKNSSADKRLQCTAAPLSNRPLSRFAELPKGLPIQCYDPSWFNDHPPHLRAKLKAKLEVIFVPNSTTFFSRGSDHKLSLCTLTAKYGKEVFEQYDLDFTAGSADNSDMDDESGESIGSEDSADDESDEAISRDKEFIDNEGIEGTGADEDEWQEGGDEEGMEGTEEENNMTVHNQAAFAAEYGFAMEDVKDVQTMSADLKREIFDGSDND
ncbi:hypothetical protein B0H10DRAFT_2237433 [Mycena sp. CBHHK59/15]|nr:hypothetical protein B0H10DRAFT_2237433 [Mycena sp. CBHHK59/15]